MRKLTLTTLLLLILVLTACQSADEADPAAKCEPVFTDIMTHDIVSEEELITIEEVEGVPFAGSLSGQAINLYEESMTLSRYASSETVAAMMQSAKSAKTIGDGSVVLDDALAMFGDDTLWVELNDELGATAAIAQYADHVLMAKPLYDGALEGMLSTFDDNLLTYIKDHPECAYLHPEKR